MPDEIRIRAYNVGFGDCLLIEFPRLGAAPFRALVDCGAHTSGYPREGWKPADTVKLIIQDVTDVAGRAHIDLVIATHRHQDHVSGFAADEWGVVSVGEVWMPWTEHPTDPLATEIRGRQSRLALGMTAAFSDAGFGIRWPDERDQRSLRGLVANSLTNAAAMRTLHRGFGGRPTRRFISSSDGAQTFDGCTDLTVHVLGPPSNPEVIRDMDPPSGQSYLRFQSAGQGFAAAASDEISEMRRRPFSPSYAFHPDAYEAQPPTPPGPRLDDRTKNAARLFRRGDDLAVAVALDRAVNGTSLMLMFEFGDAFLLFSGDAQWGTWHAAMTDPATRAVLERTTFYKVGHHGSHNGTPTDFLEQVLPIDRKLWGAFVSVRPIEFWPEIPRLPLLESLAKHTDCLVRSDDPGRSRRGVGVRPGAVGVDLAIPVQLP